MSVLAGVLGLGAFLSAAVGPAAPTEQAPVRVELLASVRQAVVEQPFLVGARFSVAPGWHIYGRYPGNTGRPTLVELVPDGGLASQPPRYPVPTLLPGTSLEERSFGYEGEALVPLEVVALERPPAGKFRLRARVSWLACKQSCVEGHAEPEVDVAVGDTEVASDVAAVFTQAAKTLPLPLEPHQAVLQSLVLKDGQITLRVALPGFPAAERFLPHWLFPAACQVVSSEIIKEDDKVPVAQLVLQGPSCLPGTGGVVCPAGDGACVELPPLRPALPAAAPVAAVAPAPVPPPVPAEAPPALWWFVLLAFLGGALLNVMPCVIPVVVPKLLHVVRSAAQVADPRERRRVLLKNALAYTAGVLGTMLALASAVVGLRGVGTQVGWGFQFQSFWFLAFMISLLTVLGLGMLHVYPLKGSGHDEALRNLKGHRSRAPLLESFLTGLLVTFLGTPCTAPLLGPALGYAFSQPGPVVFSVFASVALGLSSPFLLTGAWTGWTRILPTRVSERYDRVMRGMGFLLFGTGVWLLSVVASAHGASALEALLWFQLVLAALSWVFGLWVLPQDSLGQRLRKLAPLLLVAGGLGTYLAGGLPAASATPAAAAAAPGTHVLTWGVFSPERVDTLQRQGKPVFIDFTADWCMNCKFNERMVLEKDETRALFSELGVVALKGDFTREDPVIQQWLTRFSRAGVPLYLVVPPCRGDIVALPELLTRKDLDATVRRAGPARSCPGR